MQGSVLAFDPDSGEPLWSCKTDIGWYMVPSVVAADGVVYCLGGRSGTAALAVRAGGSGDVTATHRLWTSQKGSNVSSPVYLDGHLYWIARARGIAYCAKAATGEIVYEQRLDRAGQVYASACWPTAGSTTYRGRKDLRAGRQAEVRATGRQRPGRPRRLQRQPRRGRQTPAVAVGQVPVLRGEIDVEREMESGGLYPHGALSMSDVTRILSQIESGDPSAAEQLLPLVYEELRKLAAAKLAQEKPGQTLQATALVHEAYLRLVQNNESADWNSRGHFFGAAAEAMRRILVEQARRKKSHQGGGAVQRLRRRCGDRGSGTVRRYLGRQ